MPEIKTVTDFDKALANGRCSWPGLYPVYFICDDGGVLSYDAAKKEAESIRDSIKYGVSDGWRVIHYSIQEEPSDLMCDHTGDFIYPEED